jgi:ATP-dependent DNA helicase RecQ
MEDAIHADSNSIIVSTMHKAKGKEFDHVWLLLEDYEINTDESIRLLYVACSRAKHSLEIHTNGTLFNQFEQDEIVFEDYALETFPPQHYEMILGIKDINLGSQKYVRTSERIAHLQTDDVLYKDQVQFQTGDAPGLSDNHGGNVLLYSKQFIQKKYNSLLAKGYELVHANVEYIVFWYDAEENKEYRILLPRLRFEKKTAT